MSAGIVFWESSQRLFNPQPLQDLPWVAAAAVVGFVGNEAVATMQIRTGNRIESEALASDDLHARTDGLTSLTVLVAAGGAWLGFPLPDPILGLAIVIVIVAVDWSAMKRISARLMDAVSPELTASVRQVVAARSDVRSIEQLRLRYVGHRLHGDLRVHLSAPSQTNASAAAPSGLAL